MGDLDEESIESFFHAIGANEGVVYGASNCGTGGTPAAGRLKLATAEEGGNVGLVLRSEGRPFPLFSEPGESGRPPFVVGLAHHRPTDAFLLFAFTSQTVPCRMARFEWDGGGIRREISEGNCDSGSFAWSKSEAAALVAAVDECRHAGYFDGSPAKASSGNDEILTLEAEAEDGQVALDRSDFLRLVPRVSLRAENGESSDEEKDCGRGKGDEEQEEAELEESKAIRSVIISELLPSTGGEGLKFHHPDPNFLLPLSRSLGKELSRWRDLVNALPPPADWPELSLPTESGTEEMTSTEEEEFEKITDVRKDQFEQSLTLCQRALEKMESLLGAALASSKRAGEDQCCTGMRCAFLLGREGIASLAALERLQRGHRAGWRECHHFIEEKMDEEKYAEDEDDNDDRILSPWLQNEAETSPDTSPEIETETLECQQSDGDDMSYDEMNFNDVVEALLDSWVKEDRDLFDMLSNAVSFLQKSFTTLDQLLGAHARIQSVQGDVRLLRENAEQFTKTNAEKFVRLWNAPNSDDEACHEHPWVREAAWPRWDEDAVEAHLSFGWRASDREEHPRMNFVVDQAGFIEGLSRCIEESPEEKAKAPSYWDDADDYGDDYARPDVRKKKRLKSRWERLVKPTIGAAMRIANDFAKTGDLRNASLLIACCCSVLCNGGVASRTLMQLGDLDYYSSEFEYAITDMFQEAMKELDIRVIHTALAFFDEGSPSIEAGAHWLLDLLESGALYFPAKGGEQIRWADKDNGRGYGRVAREPQWNRYSHPAAAIFTHFGWAHPTLRSAMKGEEASAKKWSDMEAPEVMKERFNFMKELERGNEAIAIAKMASGDHDALHYLLCNGLPNDAIEIASASRNLEGLARLSKDLISVDPHASILCMQAQVLGIVEEVAKRGHHWRRTDTERLGDAVDLFSNKWPVAPSLCKENVGANQSVPPLSIFCKVALTRKFLHAAKSTHDMQALLEKKELSQSEVSLVVALLAIIAQATPPRVDPRQLHEPIQYFLKETGLLSIHDSGQYSGTLAELGCHPSSIGREGFLDMCCALYEIARYLIEKKCLTLFCIDLGLFSAMQMTFHTGSQTFALNFIRSLTDFGDEIPGPLNGLLACYAELFGSDYPFPQISRSLLESFFKLSVTRSKSYYSYHTSAAEKSRFWAAFAYMQESSTGVAADALINNIMLEQPKKEEYELDKFGEFLMGTIRNLSSADTSTSSKGVHTMSPFADSPRRQRVTEHERNQMTSVCIEKLFEVSFPFGAANIAELIDLHRRATPSFWRHGENEVNERLSNLTGIGLTLSRKKSLLQTCEAMMYIDTSLKNGRPWFSRHVILELGLSWLRDALAASPTGLIQFDNRESIDSWNNSESNYINFHEDRWDYSHGRGQHRYDRFDQRPKYAANIFTAVLQANISVLEDESPFLSIFLREAMTLCCILDFIIFPTPQRLDAVVTSQNELGFLLEEFPTHLLPEGLVSLVLDPKWSANPDFPLSSCVISYRGTEGQPTIPFVAARIATALAQGEIAGAAKLCVASSSGVFWSNLSTESSCYIKRFEMSEKASDTLHGCLLILKVGNNRQSRLPDDFVNLAMHLILSLNWFPVCEKCSLGSSCDQEIPKKHVVSMEHVTALHEAALSCSEVLDGNAKGSDGRSEQLLRCMSVIRCLSQCIQRFVENRLYPCEKCEFQSGRYCKFSFKELRQREPSTTAREKRARSRKRRKLQTSCSGSIVECFDELHSYLSRLHLKEACEWCKAGLNRTILTPEEVVQMRKGL